MNTPTTTSPLSGLLIAQAGKLWLREHSRYVKPRTVRDYEEYLKPLSAFFTVPLKEINIGLVRLYQDWRGQKAGSSRINMELSTLQQVMKEAKCWGEIAEFYRPMPISQRGSGMSVSPEEEEKLLEICFTRPRWRLAAHCLRIMLRTGFGFGELRMVQRRDVDMNERTVTIEASTAKNNERGRTVPMTEQSHESMLWILERWEGLGGRDPGDFILPHCSSRRNGPKDFQRPMCTIKKAFSGIRKEAIKQIGPHMAKFRIYDCRVTSVTKSLASGEVSIHTAQRLFGHVSQAMQKRYFKPGMDTLRGAVDVLEPIRVGLKAKETQAADNFSVMREAARLVKETGIDVETALQIVRGCQGGAQAG